MKKIKEFLTKHATEIIALLVAVSAFVSNYTNVGGTVGKICTYIVGIIAVVVATIKIITYYFSTGMDEHLVKMAVALIEMIINLINGNNNTPVSSGKDKINQADVSKKDLLGSGTPKIQMSHDEIEKEYRRLLEKKL